MTASSFAATALMWMKLETFLQQLLKIQASTSGPRRLFDNTGHIGWSEAGLDPSDDRPVR
jgi:hypothetical protein